MKDVIRDNIKWHYTDISFFKLKATDHNPLNDLITVTPLRNGIAAQAQK